MPASLAESGLDMPYHAAHLENHYNEQPGHKKPMKVAKLTKEEKKARRRMAIGAKPTKAKHHSDEQLPVSVEEPGGQTAE